MANEWSLKCTEGCAGFQRIKVLRLILCKFLFYLRGIYACEAISRRLRLRLISYDFHTLFFCPGQFSARNFISLLHKPFHFGWLLLNHAFKFLCMLPRSFLLRLQLCCPISKWAHGLNLRKHNLLQLLLPANTGRHIFVLSQTVIRWTFSNDCSKAAFLGFYALLTRYVWMG